MGTLGWIGAALAMTGTVMTIVAIVDIWRQPTRRWSRFAWTGLVVLGLAGSTRGPVMRSEANGQTEMRSEAMKPDVTERTSWLLPFIRVDREQVPIDRAGAVWTERRVSIHFGWTLPLILGLYGVKRARRLPAETQA